VFCREWLDVNDGEIHSVELSSDLSSTLGDPCLLFRASEAPWTRPLEGRKEPCYITDGPFLIEMESELLMLWSSLGVGGNYCVGCSRSANGLFGPWEHDAEPVFTADGGHCMLFERFECEGTTCGEKGRMMMALHSPNKDPTRSRAKFFHVEVLKDKNNREHIVVSSQS
jgi:arabinan endo-1,5-alpha-L-arabinosidase